MRRDDICIYVGPASRTRLEALTEDRNTPSKVVWRAQIVLATADGRGTREIMRLTLNLGEITQLLDKSPEILRFHDVPAGRESHRHHGRTTSWPNRAKDIAW